MVVVNAISPKVTGVEFESVNALFRLQVVQSLPQPGHSIGSSSNSHVTVS
jgi:hypothetical protein